MKVKPIVEAKIKTDTIDAHILAHLLRANLISAIYVPSKETRDLVVTFPILEIFY